MKGSPVRVRASALSISRDSCHAKIQSEGLRVGVQVGPIWPPDRSELLVHMDLPKELWIMAERLEDRSPQLGFEVDLAHRAVVEAEPKDEPFEWLDAADPRCAGAGAHGSGSIVSR